MTRAVPGCGGGRTAHVTQDYVYPTGSGQVHALRGGMWIDAERHTSTERADE